MSAIHQALRRATHGSDPATLNSYNPLAVKSRYATQKNRTPIFYWFLAALFLILIPIVIFWPTNVDSTLVKTAQLNKLDNPQTTVTVVKADEPQVVEITELITEPEIPSESIATANTTKQAIEQVSNLPENNANLDQSDKIIEPIVVEPAPKPNQAEITPITAKPLEPKPVPKNNLTVTQENIRQSADVVTISAQHWQTQVEQHITNGDIERAELTLKQWIGSAPKDEAPRVWLARIYLSNQLYSPAESLLMALNSTEALALKGVLFEKTQRFQLASEQFSELFKRESDSPRWLLMWAVNTENSGQLTKSIELYKAFIQNFPYEDETLTTFAQQRLRVLGSQ